MCREHLCSLTQFCVITRTQINLGSYIMTRSLSHAFLLLTAFIWGVTFVFQTTGMETLGPFGFSAFRFLVGSIAILPIALWEMREVNLWSLSTTASAQISAKERRNIFWGTIILGVIMFYRLRPTAGQPWHHFCCEYRLSHHALCTSCSYSRLCSIFKKYRQMALVCCWYLCSWVLDDVWCLP